MWLHVVGSEGRFYNSLGIFSGVHYVGHYGTLDGIKRAIDFLRENPEKAEEIAKNGKDYANIQCRPDALFDKVITLLDQDGQ